MFSATDLLKTGFLKTLIATSLCLSLSAQAEILRLATTTSTYNSGLLDYLLPEFERDQKTEVQVIAVGTGKALRMGRDGDVDVVLVHAPKAEQTFVGNGYGIDRTGIMYNDFVLVGPANDPAGIKGTTDGGAALLKVAASKTPFISRGDDSGTHKKELGLWQKAGTIPTGNWYREAGQGMGKVLQIADELGGYTLVDRGTWLAYRDKLRLKLLVEGDKLLHNPYSVIRVNPDRYDNLNHSKAITFSKWLASPGTQKRIGLFKVKGEQLFIPSAKSAN
ncbi:MAG: substrate-binding domain-containing protein [Motiliproteus sp.]|nr:substrate-binding domain-containing protein [Motiliproteus sp.]MCW9053839.1 substrate-binding domain-containing protein [Motiliproteus sp.]